MLSVLHHSQRNVTGRSLIVRVWFPTVIISSWALASMIAFSMAARCLALSACASSSAVAFIVFSPVVCYEYLQVSVTYCVAIVKFLGAMLWSCVCGL